MLWIKGFKKRSEKRSGRPVISPPAQYSVAISAPGVPPDRVSLSINRALCQLLGVARIDVEVKRKIKRKAAQFANSAIVLAALLQFSHEIHSKSPVLFGPIVR